MKENARQRYWNGALPPIGYRIVAAEQRGAKIKKKLEIDPIHADTVRLIYRLALNGDGDRGRREEWNERRRGHIAELRKRAAEAEAKLKRLYEAIENGVVDMADPSLKRSHRRTHRDCATRRGLTRSAQLLQLNVLGPAITSEQPAAVRACGATQATERRWNLSAGPFACARAARRGRRPERNPHPRHENRTATDTCRRRGRRIGGCWRSQFYTEVARHGR